MTKISDLLSVKTTVLWPHLITDPERDDFRLTVGSFRGLFRAFKITPEYEGGVATLELRNVCGNAKALQAEWSRAWQPEDNRMQVSISFSQVRSKCIAKELLFEGYGWQGAEIKMAIGDEDCIVDITLVIKTPFTALISGDRFEATNVPIGLSSLISTTEEIDDKDQ